VAHFFGQPVGQPGWTTTHYCFVF